MLHIEDYLQMFFFQELEDERCTTTFIAVCHSDYNILQFIKQEHISHEKWIGA
jgi:hypothetical protein